MAIFRPSQLGFSRETPPTCPPRLANVNSAPMLQTKDWVMHLDENALNIYTDGSCYPSPRVGGVGFLFITVDQNGYEVFHEESPPGWKGATNQQMELQACIEALSLVTGKRSQFDLSTFRKVVIHADSMYVVENFYEAMFEWPRNGWKTKSGAPVLNTPQWKELIRLVKRVGLRVEIVWVKGHKNDPHNKLVDKLAKKSARNATSKSLGPQRVRRKKSPRMVELGSVGMEGQVNTIRIVTDRYLPSPHRCYYYTYEVTDRESRYYQCVDKATSDIMLSAGHTYVVRFNDNRKNPRIEEMLVEIDEFPAPSAPKKTGTSGD